MTNLKPTTARLLQGPDCTQETILIESLTETDHTLERVLGAIKGGDPYLIGQIVLESFEDYVEQTEGYWDDQVKSK